MTNPDRDIRGLYAFKAPVEDLPLPDLPSLPDPVNTDTEEEE